MKALLVPQFGPDGGIISSFREAVLFLLNGTDFAQNARLGWITIRGSTGHDFNIMRRSMMQAPDLYLWKPITMNVDLAFPIRKGGLEIIPFDFSLTFPNPGPLHLEIGTVQVSAMNGNRSLLDIVTPGSVIVKNKIEHADDVSVHNPINLLFRVILPWGTYHPIHFIRNVLQLLNSQQYSLHIQVINSEEGEVFWITKIADKLKDMEEIKALIKVLIGLIKRMQFRLFGIGGHRN